MFLGKHSLRLDAKNRFSVPPKLREQVSASIYIIQGFDQNLLVLPVNAFQELAGKATALNIADPLARQLQRLILGTAHELSLDAQGHIMVPAELKEYAGLKQEILLIGQGNYMEVWSPDHWNEQEAQLMDANSNAAKFSGLMLAAR